MADSSQGGGLHEDFNREEEIETGSDRSFGLVFTVFFSIVGLLPMLSEPRYYRLWALIAAGVFLVPALLFPKILHPLNKLWMRFGALLQKIVSPIVLGALFFLTVTPMGLLMRLLGKDLLRLKKDANASSYWIERTPPGPPPDTMRNQF